MSRARGSPARHSSVSLPSWPIILELLAEQPHGLTRAEIVRAMGRSQSEIYRMLERLVARHCVTRSADADLDTMLDKVRAAGGWQGRSRQAEDVIDLSLPVPGSNGEAVAVLTCPYVRRIDRRHIGVDVDTTRELLHEAATAPSLRLMRFAIVHEAGRGLGISVQQKEEYAHVPERKPS